MKAQTSLLATLSHDGGISIFTGSKAFINAYNASVDGDVITLSSGQFESTNINKSLTIRGAGMTGSNATLLSGNFYVGLDNKTCTLTMEGIETNSEFDVYVSDATFLKCYFPNIILGNMNSGSNLRYIHCIFNLDGRSNPKGYYSGCFIRAGAGSDCSIENCIFELTTTHSSVSYNTNFLNSIIIGGSNVTKGYADSKNTFNGCVFIGDCQDPFASKTIGEGNMAFPAGTEFLKEGTTTYELLDELQSTWLGTDGKQVGMHGGQLPFDPTTTAPQFKKFDVSSKTSADGKLAVDIAIDVE